MGQTPSKENQVAELYSNYIQQQQNLIFQQQQQINNLFMNNLQMEQQMTPNMFFQNMNKNDQNTNNNPNSDPINQNLPTIQSKKAKLDPYKILNISKNYDEYSLKKSYLKAAMKHHPDRGGTPGRFQQVSIAYALLKNKLKEKDNNHSHNELKDNSQSFVKQQGDQPKTNIHMNDNFDIDIFNKIYDDNKIKDVYDEGYNSWMEETSGLNNNHEKLFQSGFNKDLFNSTFDQFKNELTKKQMNNGTLVKYQEPETTISLSNKDSLMNLGQDKITNFGGNTDNLIFTDYKQAFTDGSTLIDTNTVDIHGRSTSMKGIESERSNISYTMSQEDQQRLAIQNVQKQNEEKNRIERLNIYDNKHQQNYEKIHSLLLR